MDGFQPYHEHVLEQLLNCGDRIALIDPETEQTLSFEQVHQLSRALAASLQQYGMRKGDVLMQCMPNDIYSPVVFLGTALAGGICSGVNPAATETELKKQMEDSNARFIVADHENFDKVDRLTTGVMFHWKIKKVFLVGQRDKTKNSYLMTNFEDEINRLGRSVHPVTFEPDDVVLLPYSSGTTGRPKGVMLTHRNIMSLLASQAPMREKVIPMLDLPDNFMDIPTIILTPFYHMTGFFATMNTLRSGGCSVPMRKFRPERFLQLIHKYKPMTLGLVPPLVLFLTKSPLTRKYDLSSVQVVSCGGASLGAELSKEFVDKYPNLKVLLQGYGMTELTLTATWTPPVPRDQIRHGSIGKPIEELVELKLVDPDSGRTVTKPFDRGEIWVRGKTVMKGYVHNVEATSHTIDKEHWLHTGDIAYCDEDGFYFIVDRIKELIKVKGLQVAPAELEDLLTAHPDISDAAVVGVPHERTGEAPRAFIVTKAGRSISAEQIMQFMQSKVAPYKQLTGGVFVLRQIPKSPSGKILRRTLVKLDVNKLNAKL